MSAPDCAAFFFTEEQLTEDFTTDAVEPIWRGDCGWAVFIRVDSGLADYDLSPENQQSKGEIWRVKMAALNGQVGQEEMLVPDPFVPEILGGLQFSNVHARFSPTKICWRGNQEWVIAWQTQPGPVAIWGLKGKVGQFPNRNAIRLTSVDPDALNPNSPEFSVPGMDPDRADRVWIIHEQDGFPGCLAGGGQDDTVRSRVNFEDAHGSGNCPITTTQRSEPVSCFDDAELSVNELPNWSLRLDPGYSFRYAMFFPMGSQFNRFIAVRYGFDDVDPDLRPVRTAIEDKSNATVASGVFSPDGKYFAFVSRALDQNGVPVPLTGQIWVAEFPSDPTQDGAWPINNKVPSENTPQVWRVSFDPGAAYAGPPSWSWDSKTLVYLKKIEYPPQSGNFFWQIVMRQAVPDPQMPLPIQPEVLISERPDRNYYRPSFSPCEPACYILYQREVEDPTNSTNIKFQIFRRLSGLTSSTCLLH